MRGRKTVSQRSSLATVRVYTKKVPATSAPYLWSTPTLCCCHLPPPPSVPPVSSSLSLLPQQKSSYCVLTLESPVLDDKCDCGYGGRVSNDWNRCYCIDFSRLFYTSFKRTIFEERADFTVRDFYFRGAGKLPRL